MKLVCETCPWNVPFQHQNKTYVSCRNHLHNLNADEWVDPDYWCSLHPSAPKPVYELGIVHPEATLHDGWEPMPAYDEFFNVMIRRIVGYTKGGEE